MAHKTKVGGTTYEIKGGKTKVGGTNYSIKGGKTKVGGTNYDIAFGNGLFSFTVKSSGKTITYYAEEGMTFSQFIKSGYNDGKFTIYTVMNVVQYNGIYLKSVATNNIAMANDVINSSNCEFTA